MEKTIELPCVSQSLSPITHMQGVRGNEMVVNREAVTCADGVRYVPVISGNALRHSLVREPGARWLIDAYELRDRINMSLDVVNFLLHGGALTEKGGRVALSVQGELFRCFPLLRLLGCSLPSMIVPGTLDVLRGTLLCRENQGRIVLPEFPLPGRLRHAVSFVDPYTYYRHTAQRNGSDFMLDEDKDYDGMIFSGQSIMAGSVWVHGFRLRQADDLHLGCLLHALACWREHDGTIGGMASKGHGRLDTYFVSPEFDQQKLIDGYVDYAMSIADDAVQFLQDTFGPKKEPSKKKSAKKKVKA